ncbi:hypothetical protein SPHINGOT1_360003 [Sphingomonas sp. T1]|nr:hypothetical protein SPHINGOT1_360003 [Sphingomonas sp. T1]
MEPNRLTPTRGTDTSAKPTTDPAAKPDVLAYAPPSGVSPLRLAPIIGIFDQRC